MYQPKVAGDELSLSSNDATMARGIDIFQLENGNFSVDSGVFP